MKQILTLLFLLFSVSLFATDYLAEAEYYQKKADNYRREAEYYEKKAKGYEREAEYYIKKAEGYQREAAYCSKKGDINRANTQTRYARDYRTQMRYAKEADDKAAMYLRWATQ